MRQYPLTLIVILRLKRPHPTESTMMIPRESRRRRRTPRDADASPCLRRHPVARIAVSARPRLHSPPALHPLLPRRIRPYERWFPALGRNTSETFRRARTDVGQPSRGWGLGLREFRI